MLVMIIMVTLDEKYGDHQPKSCDTIMAKNKNGC